MRFKPILSLIRQGQLLPLFRLGRDVKYLYRLCYLASAGKNGVLAALSGHPMPFELLARDFCKDEDGRDALQAWLDLGVHLGELKLAKEGYAVCGYSKKLVRPENDSLLAMIEEVVALHCPLILDTPGRLKQGEKWSLSDQDGEMIARSSRVLEPFQTEVIDHFFPASGPVRLLEVGCGSGIYMQYAAQKNPELSAVGVELQAEVAAMAQKNLETWDLSDRTVVVHGDIRDRKPEALFDIVTLYNNIYYFPVAERRALLAHLMAFLKPGGMLLLTTCCQDGSLTTDVMHLWGSATAGCGGLPVPGELKRQMEEAGFSGVRIRKLLPGESFYAFVGTTTPVC